MPKFAAMLFTEQPFLDAGFQGGKYLFPYGFDRRQLAARLNRRSTSLAKYVVGISSCNIISTICRSWEVTLRISSCVTYTTSRAARGQSRSPSAKSRGNQLRLSILTHRPPCLRRVDRTRVQAKDGEGGRAELVRPLWRLARSDLRKPALSSMETAT
jgi:hypothetical protein